MFKIIPMTSDHIEQVVKLEEVTFHIPWTRADFERELNENKMAIYFVAVIDEKVVGYAGLWHVVTEGHITNIAVLEDYRRMGIGAAFIEKIIETAKENEMIGITLEVRISNIPAQKLYTKYGFKPEGFRKKYQDTGEDAVIMWKYFEFYENYKEEE